MSYLAILASTTTVNFAGDWNSVNTALNSALGSTLITFLGVVGTLLIVFSVIKYIWDRRRTGQGNHTHVMWTLAIGAILAVPSVVMPSILTVLDAVVSVFLKVLP